MVYVAPNYQGSHFSAHPFLAIPLAFRSFSSNSRLISMNLSSASFDSFCLPMHQAFALGLFALSIHTIFSVSVTPDY